MTGDQEHSKETVARLIKNSPRPLRIIFKRNGTSQGTPDGSVNGNEPDDKQILSPKDSDPADDRPSQQTPTARRSSKDAINTTRRSSKDSGSKTTSKGGIATDQATRLSAGTEQQWEIRKRELMARHMNELNRLEKEVNKKAKAVAKLEQQVKAGARAHRAMGKVAAQCANWLKYEPQ